MTQYFYQVTEIHFVNYVLLLSLKEINTLKEIGLFISHRQHWGQSFSHCGDGHCVCVLRRERGFNTEDKDRFVFSIWLLAINCHHFLSSLCGRGPNLLNYSIWIVCLWRIHYAKIVNSVRFCLTGHGSYRLKRNVII